MEPSSNAVRNGRGNGIPGICRGFSDSATGSSGVAKARIPEDRASHPMSNERAINDFQKDDFQKDDFQKAEFERVEFKI
jgi:hypothetical protein